MAKTRHHRRSYTPAGGPLGQQATIMADLKFSPEASALGQLLMSTRREFKQQVRQERGVASAVSRSAKRAIPGVQQDYQRAQNTLSGAYGRLNAQLAPLSPIADDIVAAAQREQAGQTTRLAESRASAVGELRSRRSQAHAAAQFNIQNARRQFVQDKGDIASQILGLARQRGEFTAATLAQLQQAERDAALTRRGQDLTFKGKKVGAKLDRRKKIADITGIDPATGKPTLAARKEARQARKDARDAGKKDGPTRAQRVAARGKYEQGVAQARQLVEGGFLRGGKNSKGEKVPPGTLDELIGVLTDKLGSAPIAKAAVQQVMYGGAGPRVRRRIKRRFGIKVPGRTRQEQRRRSASRGAARVLGSI